MPELPEVETVVQTLNKVVLNQQIIDFKIYLQKTLKNSTENQLIKVLLGNEIKKVSRKAKHIIFNLKSGDKLVSHLRMEGKYYYGLPDSLERKHILFEIFFQNKNALSFHDTRRFGTLHLQEKTGNELETLSSLGPEPSDKKCNPQYLFQICQKRRIAIKTLLLNQKIIAGLGNIYVDETLFKSRLHPCLPANKVSLMKSGEIIRHANFIFKKAISMGGTTIASFSYHHGISGKFQNELKVHTRKNMPCFKCGTTIEKIKVNGRGTYFCPRCQSLN